METEFTPLRTWFKTTTQALAVCLAWVVISVPSPALAFDRSEIFGVMNSGALVRLPKFLCVYPGSELRLTADVKSSFGMRQHKPFSYFLWKFTHPNGEFEEYQDTVTRLPLGGDGVFTEGSIGRADFPLMDQIHVRVPGTYGGIWRLEVNSPTRPVPRHYLINADPYRNDPFYTQRGHRSFKCEWADPEVYTSGSIPPEAYR